MTCPRCRRSMVEQGRVYHGQRKWICPRCGKVRFQPVKKRPPPGR